MNDRQPLPQSIKRPGRFKGMDKPSTTLHYPISEGNDYKSTFDVDAKRDNRAIIESLFDVCGSCGAKTTAIKRINHNANWSLFNIQKVCGNCESHIDHRTTDDISCISKSLL